MLVALALGVTPLACGSSKDAPRRTTGGSALVTAYFPHDSLDRDNDSDHDDDDARYLEYGRAANPAELREALALVRGYYAAATAENGARACAMLDPIIAESVAEKYGQSPGVTGKTCAVVMSKIFANHHAALAVEDTTFRIPEIRVLGDKGLAILEFPTIPEVRKLELHRVDGTWRVLDLLDTLLE
jgi:hypothetical protein